MPLLEVLDLSVEYPTAQGVVRAADRVSLDLDQGEILGIVGESGSGKTTVLLSVLRLVPSPGRVVSGKVLLAGRDFRALTPGEMRRLRGRDLAYVPQAAMSSLNPVIRVGAQIAESLVLHTDLSRQQTDRRVREVLEMVDLPSDTARHYPHELSGGMRQRAVIAMALAPGPRVILADEPTSGLDVLVRVQILELLRRIVSELGLALLLVSHDLRLVARRCDRAVVMYAGRVVEEGPAGTLLSAPRHPYARGLARSLPNLRGPIEVSAMTGEVPDLTRPPAGCRFNPRCPQALAVCSQVEPDLVALEDGHVACHLHGA